MFGTRKKTLKEMSSNEIKEAVKERYSMFKSQKCKNQSPAKEGWLP